MHKTKQATAGLIVRLVDFFLDILGSKTHPYWLIFFSHKDLDTNESDSDHKSINLNLLR